MGNHGPLSRASSECASLPSRTGAQGRRHHLASQVWVDAAAALVRFTGDKSDFRRWLFTIVRRRLTDYRRREGRRRIATDRVEEITCARPPRS